MLRSLEEKLVFQPSPASEGDWNPVGLGFEDVFFTTDDSLLLHGWYCECPSHLATRFPSQARPVFVLFHGNAGNLSHRADLIRAYQLHLGVDCFIIDYRGYGKSEGRPTEQGLYQDSRAAYSWVTRDRGISSDRLVFFGRSLGGAVALELALEAKHRCLVLESTFTSLPDVAAQVYPWLAPQWLMRIRFANDRRISNYSQPLLIAHGDQDTLVPIDHALKLYALANQPKTLLQVVGAGHNDLVYFGGESYFATIASFLTASFSHTDQPGSDAAEPGNLVPS